MKTLGVGIVGTGWVSGEHVRAFESAVQQIVERIDAWAVEPRSPAVAAGGLAGSAGA